MNALNNACNINKICTRNIYKPTPMNQNYQPVIIEVVSKIIDIDTNLPIENVNVYLENNPQIGTTTDSKGEFSLTVEGNQKVVLSHVTYGKTTLLADDIENVEYLQTQTNMLPEVDLGTLPKRQQASFGFWALLILAGLYLGTRKNDKKTVKTSV